MRTHIRLEQQGIIICCPSAPQSKQEWRGGCCEQELRVPHPGTGTEPRDGEQNQGWMVWHNHESQNHVQKGGKDRARGTAGVEVGNGAEMSQTGAHTESC